MRAGGHAPHGLGGGSNGTLLSREDVQAASDVYSPVSGEVIEANSTLAEDPAKVQPSPPRSSVASSPATLRGAPPARRPARARAPAPIRPIPSPNVAQ